MKMHHFAFGNGMEALSTLQQYKQRRQLRVQPTREFHRAMNDFQRLNGFRLVTYADFVDNFFVRPRTGDMRQMVDDILPLLWR